MVYSRPDTSVYICCNHTQYQDKKDDRIPKIEMKREDHFSITLANKDRNFRTSCISLFPI